MKISGRSTPERRAQQREIARAQWTLERRKAHSKRQVPVELHAAIDAMTAAEFGDYAVMRANKHTPLEAIAYVENLRRRA